MGVHVEGEVSTGQFPEDQLQLVENAVLLLDFDGGVIVPLEDGIPEGGVGEQGLEQTVHVAGGPTVQESFIILRH